jgi:pSer/pThr/pTyr-binding forkhead associated (FHA) protein
MGGGQVSTVHATIGVACGGGRHPAPPLALWVRDEGSANGTWVNGERLSDRRERSRRRTLLVGDALSIGGTTFVSGACPCFLRFGFD